jgi:hypothetical protein
VNLFQYLISQPKTGLQRQILVTIFMITLTAPIHIQAALVISEHNNFESTTIQNVPDVGLVLAYFGWQNMGFSGESPQIQRIGSEFGDLVPLVTKQPLVFPNPCRLADSPKLGYELNRTDIDINFLVYDMRGNKISDSFFEQGSEGAKFGYNRVPLDEATLGRTHLPSGPYFFLLVHHGQVLGKGKFIVTP